MIDVKAEDILLAMDYTIRAWRDYRDCAGDKGFPKLLYAMKRLIRGQDINEIHAVDSNCGVEVLLSFTIFDLSKALAWHDRDYQAARLHANTALVAMLDAATKMSTFDKSRIGREIRKDGCATRAKDTAEA